MVRNEVVRVKIPKCMSWLDAYDEPIGDLDMMEDKVDNPRPQSTPQVLPSFELYTPPVTYSKEVEETLGTPMEVEPLEETHLEDLGFLEQSRSLGVDFLNIEMIEDDLKLEPKEESVRTNLKEEAPLLELRDDSDWRPLASYITKPIGMFT
nr:hypothetical protein [Tanacetum cinerariifolium]